MGPAPAPETPPPAPPASASELDRLIDGVESRTSTITDFEAKFFQEVRRKHLPRPLRRSGTVFFKKPGMMRWDYKVPERVYYISDGEVLWSYEAREKLAYKLPVKNSELYSALKFLFGQGELRAEFTIRLVEAKGGLRGLELTPKVPQSGYTKLVLEVSPDTFEIRSTVLFDPVGNESRIRFDDVKTGRELKVEAFQFTPPPGVRVEDLTRAAPASDAP
jgi:outer membrane lipoprotein carrier protein